MSVLVTIKNGTGLVAVELSQTVMNMLMSFNEHVSYVTMDACTGEPMIHSEADGYITSVIVFDGDYSEAMTSNINMLWRRKLKASNNEN